MADGLDPVDASQQGNEAFSYFVPIGIQQVIEFSIKAQQLCRERGLMKLYDEVSALFSNLLAELRNVAVQMVGVADATIVRKMLETQSRNRPQTLDMESHVRSEVGPVLGMVRVALLDELDKIVNPVGEYGPFWRAQEFGTGTETGDPRFGSIPSQEGRIIFGTFHPGNTPPDSEQRGLGAGHDLAFIPQGSNPGFGTINVELPGRHFLRDGAREAGEVYIAKMKAIEAKYTALWQGLTAQLGAGGGAAGFTGRIAG